MARINHHTEETQCAGCGYPLYVGDTAHEDKVEGVVIAIYCNRSCADRHFNQLVSEDAGPIHGYDY